MKTCPNCGNEISDELLNKTKKCFFCDNTDFSEKAMELLGYEFRKVNCTSCGALMTTQDAHTINPIFHKFSKKLEVGRFDWVYLCKKCDDKIDVTLIPIQKIIRRISHDS